MKLVKRLLIGNKEVPLVTEDVRLQINTPGRAFFVVAKPVERGIVSFDIGYTQGNTHRYFHGYVESITKISANHYSVFCQEFSAALNRRITTNLRHVTLADVTQELTNQTAVQFILPDEQYVKSLAPCFYSVGGGYHYMDKLADIYSIPKFMWQQQANGKIFVGSWEHSQWKGKEIDMPEKWLANHGVNGSAQLPVIPSLKPGVYINGRGLVTKTALKTSKVNINWSDKFWNKPLKSW